MRMKGTNNRQWDTHFVFHNVAHGDVVGQSNVLTSGHQFTLLHQAFHAFN